VFELKKLLGETVTFLLKVLRGFLPCSAGCRELQVKREQLGSRCVDGVVCVGFVSVPAGDKLSTER
jgi:hypothetical protein